MSHISKIEHLRRLVNYGWVCSERKFAAHADEIRAHVNYNRQRTMSAVWPVSVDREASTIMCNQCYHIVCTRFRDDQVEVPVSNIGIQAG
jgi:hypothetical protein